MPAGIENPFHAFAKRVANLLAMLKIPDETILRELEHYRHFQIGRTRSRVVLGCMNDFAFLTQRRFDDATPENPVSLSDLEMYLARSPMSPLGYRQPRKLAQEILLFRWCHGTDVIIGGLPVQFLHSSPGVREAALCTMFAESKLQPEREATSIDR